MNAGPYLRRVAADLAQKLRTAPDSVFSGMPPGWNQASWFPGRLANIIERVCFEENENRSRREGWSVPPRPLVFDYCDGSQPDSPSCQRRDCTDGAGQYISALGKYFDMNEVVQMPEEELQTRLLHEASHLFGLSEEYQARPFAKRLLSALLNPGKPFYHHRVKVRSKEVLHSIYIVEGKKVRSCLNCRALSFESDTVQPDSDGKGKTDLLVSVTGWPGTRYEVTQDTGLWARTQAFKRSYKLDRKNESLGSSSVKWSLKEEE